jgi:hypothetical protein
MWLVFRPKTKASSSPMPFITFEKKREAKKYVDENPGTMFARCEWIF